MSSVADVVDREGDPIVVVGGGLAGVKALEGVRAAGFSGRLVLVSEELHTPYDRPPLSKQVLSDPGHEHRIALQTAEALAHLKAELQLGRRAMAIDRATRNVALSDGGALPYARLILATGSRLRPLPQLPPGSPGVFYLRTLDDALQLRTALAAARRIAVVGGGVIGLEVAAFAIQAGLEVILVEAGDRVMGRAAAPVVSAYLADLHRRHGVELRLGSRLASAETDGPGLRLHLESGETCTVDLAVVGVGVTPDLTLAEGCGLAVHPSGVVVDGQGRTDDPAIFVAGEAAFHFNARAGRHDRQETWAHAAAHGEHVGRAAVAPLSAYAELSSYWSDQYDASLQVLGEPVGEQDVVRGDPAEGRFLVLHLIGGCVRGASAVNAARELRAAKALILAKARIAPERLADASTDLKTILTPSTPSC